MTMPLNIYDAPISLRFCEVEVYHSSVNDLQLQLETVDMSQIAKKFILLSSIVGKVIMFQTPECKQANKAQALTCWSKGKI